MIGKNFLVPVNICSIINSLIKFSQNFSKMKKSSRNWSPDEDKLLQEIMTQSSGDRKFKWEEIAQMMHKRINSCQKTGKQCRERWHNHLAPELNNSSQWTSQQNNILFQKHSQLGNKWAKIAIFLKGRTDNCVKNHFYSTLRRGMRKVNNYIHEQRKIKSSLKEFKPDVLTKILITADGDPEQKLNAKNNAQILAKQIKELLIEISLDTDEQTYQQQKVDEVIRLIMEFNKNCKKRKGKKKAIVVQKNDAKIEQSQQSEEQMSSEKSESRKMNSSEESFKKTNIAKSQNQKVEDQINHGTFFMNNFTREINEPYIKTEGYNAARPIIKKDLSQQVDNQQVTTNKRAKVNRSQSIQLDLPFQNNFNSFNIPNTIKEEEYFKNSGFNNFSPFTPLAEPQQISKTFFADSGIGIKKGDAFLNLSGYSDHGSFFSKLDGDKGTLDLENWGNRKESNC